MSVANLTRYDQDRDCDCGQTCLSGMCEYPDGEYVKFEEAVEASSNNLQQLKAEIAALATRLEHYPDHDNNDLLLDIVDAMRQLSAV